MVFKRATLVYKFLHTGFPRYFAPYLSSYNSSYSTRLSQSGGNFLVIPKFYPSVHKSVKQFDNSFAFDASTVWHTLPDDIRASPKPTCTPKHIHLSLDHPLVCLTPLLSLDIEIWSTAFSVLLRLRVLLYGEIKCYKSPIRIRITLGGDCRCVVLKCYLGMTFSSARMNHITTFEIYLCYHNDMNCCN